MCWSGRRWMRRIGLPCIVRHAEWSASLLRRAIAHALPLSVALYGASALFALPVAYGEESAAATHTYAIRAGNLRNALDTFAAQRDIQIVYSPELVAGKITRGVSGRFTPADALQRLLAGTGLMWKAINASTFVLESSTDLPALPAKTTSIVIDEKPKVLGGVTVSGSLIGNADIQTATPTYTITAADIRARGFDNLADVLRNSVLATGSVQGPQAAGSFTQGAQTVSLFGLSPQFTLILLDGKPIADFGRLYNGTINFTSISNFPIGIVDHIDVMPGGASSIYGSQAIGGVINIVTKSHWHGSEISVQAGGYSDGGGANQRISGVYGNDVGKWNVLAAMEFDNASPIWLYQRPSAANLSANAGGASLPSTQAAIVDFGNAATYTGNPLSYVSPPNGCATQLFGGSTVQVTSKAPNPPGDYCGSNNLNGYTTYSNQLRNLDGMLKLAYQLNDRTTLYGTAMANWQQQRWFPGVSAWFPDDLPESGVEDANTGHYLYLQKYFAPEEMPDGVVGQMYRQNDLLYQVSIGAKGQWGDSGWNWDLYYLRTGDRTDVVEPLAIASDVDAFFGKNILGPVLGVDPRSGLNLYHPNYNAFFQAITPAQYASFTQGVGESSRTWINDTRATISNASLFALPGGDAGVAVLVESGNEAWYEPVNPLFTQGDVFEHAATGGGGQRSHAASAFELNLPLLKPLTIDLSGRYDYYALDHGSDNRKFTYKAGVEVRPFSTLLIRGNYTTSFKAPDLSSIYLGPTDYYTTITDYYLCALAQSNSCGTAYLYGVRGTTLANPKLQSTSAQSWTLGTVWSPTDDLNISVDYLHIAIQNEVVQQDLDLLMRTDAQCLLAQNPNASGCQSVINQVTRAGEFGPVTGITTYYANLANEITESIMGTARYRYALSHVGVLNVQLDYNNMLKHDYQIAPGEAPINSLTNSQYSTEFKSIIGGSLTWTSPNGQWTSTLYGHRYGPSPNYIATNDGTGTPGAGHVSPWITFNGSASYRPTRNLSISLLVNNIANKMPPRDASFIVYPYFNNENYNIYGREISLLVDMKLGNPTY